MQLCIVQSSTLLTITVLGRRNGTDEHIDMDENIKSWSVLLASHPRPIIGASFVRCSSISDLAVTETKWVWMLAIPAHY